MDKEYRRCLKIAMQQDWSTPRTAEEKAERKSFATLCGHVSRRLYRNERLTGSVLELAVRAAPDQATAEKLRNGEPIGDYEKHLIVDVALLHMRLA
ncbi:hypothetical protein JQ636_35535 [Bradyrhizobium japonicum]|uniref:hypothetical protein n=1 Tax=Bradyrhizobium japonicum TaxID=375 RepID=UPI001BA7A7D9|nr:hypothetical protein [Bradyrhizobium japonicum]MBR0808872.1 hypothetical protein [Bradyrhizobium japonicum]